MKTIAKLFIVPFAFAGIASASAAPSTFQNTCSNIAFGYQGSDAALNAVCLKKDGSPNASSLLIQGISNQNGKLTAGSGSSSFQQSCGDIQVMVDGPNVSISALCRKTDGSSVPSTIELQGVSNNDGKLTY